MKFKRFIEGAIAADGGTISCRAEMEDSSILEFGLDARIPKPKQQRLIFVGAGYPTMPGAQTFARNSQEEHEFIEAFQDLVSRQPPDKMADMLLRGILNR